MSAADRATWRAGRAALGQPRFDWNESRVAQLTRRWAEGASASVIARELGGVSRSAVLGKVHRLKLRQPDAKLQRIRRVGAGRPRRFGARRGPRPGGALLKAAFRALGLDPPAGAPDARLDHASAGKAFGTPCGLLELSDRTCRWPVGEPGEAGFVFCGAAPFAHYPYCVGHCLIAYRTDEGEGAPAPARHIRKPGIARAFGRAA
jgi:GcrA cell cycle regulator